MEVTYTCELCSRDYHSEDDFITCRGDACNEQVCRNCAKSCRNPKCVEHVCETCQASESSGPYCSDCMLIDESDPMFGPAVTLFQETYGDDSRLGNEAPDRYSRVLLCDQHQEFSK